MIHHSEQTHEVYKEAKKEREREKMKGIITWYMIFMRPLECISGVLEEVSIVLLMFLLICICDCAHEEF